ncbi:protein LONGIFOLIA 2 [Striga asiatica]|uniref:Protein LONGIFOLIA 2 n=1 Tax=Striga asiatica TaxID=4170 RepID=A0A5A7QVN3_STRAF|nr:protein LONGIFOLIA 2 [Striga asiatica]
MSAKTMSSLRDENRDLRKQIGCMNGILQLFDRHHLLTGRRVGGHHHKRLLQGTQHQLEPQYATGAITEKARKSHKEKPRISTESSCTSTFSSSLDFNRIAQPETLPLRQKNKPESTKEPQSLDLRDVVKDSMYREARGLSIKHRAPKDEKKGTVMKHVDSPRPPPQSKPKTPKPHILISEGSGRVLAGAHEITRISKDERPSIGLPRFSYDGRESRDGLRWAAAKHKELPRLSLDSKASSMKKCWAHESRRNFLDQDPHAENENPGHNRTSSIVAKLMGLENFPDPTADENGTPTTKSCPNEAFLENSSLTPQNQASYFSPRFPPNDPASPSPRSHGANFGRKTNTCSRIPIEPAPWRQQDSSQGSAKVALDKRRSPTNSRNVSSSVYGEIEKRITELQFQKSGKDLRALKHILEAMQKTRERLEERTEEPIQCTLQRKSNNRVLTIEGHCNPKQLGSPVPIIKPAKVMEKVRFPIPNKQEVRTRNSKYYLENSVTRPETKVLTSKNKIFSTDKRTSRGASELDRTMVGPQRKKVVVSPRLQHNVLRIEGQSPPTTPSPDSVQVKNHCRKNLTEKGSRNRKYKVKPNDMQFSDEHLGELSSETRHSSYQHDTASVVSDSSNSQVSQAATDVIDLVHLVNTDAAQKENSVSMIREDMPAVKPVITISEQPSPISVLDNTFYSEDSPSPVKKISTVFQDETTCPDEAEWHLENVNHLTNCKRPNHAHMDNQKLENLRNSVQELTLSTKPDPTAVGHHSLLYQSLHPDHKYINRILLTSGLLKHPSVISPADQLLSSCHLINPNMFHVLEQTEEISPKSDIMKLNNKRIERKIIFDLVDETLVRKITSGGLFTSGNKMTSPQVLLKEVYIEMDRACRIQDSSLDDEEDEMNRLLTADMMYQDDWVNYGGEVPALVLDIERLIFKDLINELITGEGIGSLRDCPFWYCRKLFSK